MKVIKTIEGKLQADGFKFAIIASRFNSLIVEQLINGAVDFLLRHGASEDNLTIVKVPGAFEIGLVAKACAESKKFNGLICLGAIIRGATPHFDFLAAEVVKNLAQINLEYKIPVGFGVLTTDTLEQAIERAGTKAGNKGAEAAAASLEMVSVLRDFTDV